MTSVTDYAEYLRTEKTAWHNKFMAKMATIQAAKNSSAPVVSGSGASVPAQGEDFSNIKMGKLYRPTAGKVTQGWGASKIKYAAGRHTGVDFGGSTGAAIRAAMSGTVTFAGSYGAYGNAIKIKHANGTTSLYGHLNSINVKKGQKVKGGFKIGGMGNTGRSTGTHLHFEIRGRDAYGADINPMKYLH